MDRKKYNFEWPFGKPILVEPRIQKSCYYPLGKSCSRVHQKCAAASAAATTAVVPVKLHYSNACMSCCSNCENAAGGSSNQQRDHPSSGPPQPNPTISNIANGISAMTLRDNQQQQARKSELEEAEKAFTPRHLIKDTPNIYEFTETNFPWK